MADKLFYVSDRDGRYWSGDFHEFLRGDDFVHEFDDEAEACALADRVDGVVIEFSRPSERQPSSYQFNQAAE